MANNKGVSVRISQEVCDKLNKLKHPGQSFNGLILEMLGKLPICPLCGKPSLNGYPHKECMDREAALADR